ncbi:MAG: trypsin-like serine peptidase, partial [Calditrichia bacterium]
MITRYKLSLVFIVLSALVLMPVVLNGQTANIPYHNEPYNVDSGVYNGEALGSDITKVFSRVIQIDGSSWLRLLFSDANLGENSYIEITSLKDQARQRLDAHTLVQWFYASAYFNGEAVKLELFAAKTDNNVFVRMQEIMVGEYVTGPMVRSQCGPTDDRVSSNDPAVGRIVPIGCTGWLIPNGLVVTAGHCLDGSGANVLEFNVPPSLPGGTIQHPPPEDQYSVIPSSKIFTNGGIGNDWGTFEVFDNSITGLHPMVAQGAFFTLAQDLTPPDIRITGFGVDGGVDNQTQQTHVGPNVGSTGTTMRYQTDTQGGNSGSPVIDDSTHFAVGVHTHGGCNTNGTGNNNGTSTFHPQFWAALNVPGNFLPDSPENFSAYSDYTLPT